MWENPPGLPPERKPVVRSSGPAPDPIEADISRKGWCISLREQLPNNSRQTTEALRKVRICDRRTDLPTLIADILEGTQQIQQLIVARRVLELSSAQLK